MKFFYALGFFVSSYVLYKYRNKQREANLLVIHSNSKLAKFFKLITDHFLEDYTQSFWMYTGHAQTLLVELMDVFIKMVRQYFKYFKFKYRQEVFHFSDGGKTVVDIATTKKHESDKNKILLVIPGFTSTSEEFYMQHVMEDFVEEFECRVLNTRGFGGIKLTTPHMINSHCYKDVREYIMYLAREYPDKKLFAIGFSYGGMLLARCLGTEPEKLPKNLVSGCGICYPICLSATRDYVEKSETIRSFYSRFMAKSLKKAFLQNVDVIFSESTSNKICHQNLIDNKIEIIDTINKLTYVSEFDTVYTCKILNFPTLQHYYKDANIIRFIEKIKIPFLSIFSKDDPVIPYEAIPLKIYQNNPHLVTIISPKGGHLGFFKGFIPQRWIDIPIKTFIKTVEIIFDVDEKNQRDFISNINSLAN